ncbi:MAG: hypothetical protein EBZ69_09030 [Alphaproteobacteria bacterium]|nr:hypothetical protein [Alphaproteobacteria bacterium]NDC56927.1 hypothetical protein [Alphaproteobacteria bacterium]
MQTTTTRTYFFYYSPLLSEFLTEYKIEGYEIKNDSDVLVVKLQGHNDTCLALLMMEFNNWLVQKAKKSFEFV